FCPLSNPKNVDFLSKAAPFMPLLNAFVPRISLVRSALPAQYFPPQKEKAGKRDLRFPASCLWSSLWSQ
ncbi:MAG: hypothetical protein ABR907_06315, partial [Terracidiphilus sp.]